MSRKSLVRKTFLIVLGVVAAGLVLSFALYPPAYVARVLVWQSSDVDDYQRFPERPIQSPEESFQFEKALDKERVAAAFESSPHIDELDLFLEQTQTQAFIVIRDAKVVYEGYFNGTQRVSIVTSFSTAKSFDSALIGIAIDEGYINSVRDPITDYLPELLERDQRFASITIRDLLLMSSGIKYVEYPFLNGDDAKTYYYPDLRRLALEETRIVSPPGQVFLYNDFHPLLLGLILERATGQSVASYLQDKLWQPLGMEYDATWSLDGTRSGFEKNGERPQWTGDRLR